MSKKNIKSIHISIPIDLYNDLKNYSSDRSQSMTATMKYALETLFSIEPMESKKFNKLKKAITKYFMIPQGFLLHSFWLSLFMIGKNIPNGNSRKWWGDMVYKADKDYTNQEIIQLIAKEVHAKTTPKDTNS